MTGSYRRASSRLSDSRFQMQHKGTQYSVVQSVAPSDWKWAVNTERGTRIGTARNHTLAILRAIKAIDKEERQIRAARRKSEQLERKGAHDVAGRHAPGHDPIRVLKNAPVRTSATRHVRKVR